jgi:hypothetical protein
VLSAELVEVNPILDSMNSTAKLGVELLASLLGNKSFDATAGDQDDRMGRDRSLCVCGLRSACGSPARAWVS